MFRMIPLALSGLIAGSAAAQSLDDVVSAQILPGWRTSDGSHIAALHVDLAPGWKTYWRAPGDAGIPPVFEWAPSTRVDSFQVSWPAPNIFEQNGMRSIGYVDSMTLPLHFTPDSEGTDIVLDGVVELGVCEDVCIPVSLKIKATLPADETAPDPRIASALAARPFSASEAGVRDVQCHIAPAEDGLQVTAHVTAPSAGRDEFAVIEADDPEIWVAEGHSERRGDTLVVTTVMSHFSGGAFALDRSDVRITVLGSRHAIDIRGCTAG